MPLELTAPEHMRLRTLVNAEKIRHGETSVRNRIHRAIVQLMKEKEKNNIPPDVLLMFNITGHDVYKPNYPVYDGWLRELSGLMGVAELFGGEYEWTQKMLGKQ